MDLAVTMFPMTTRKYLPQFDLTDGIGLLRHAGTYNIVYQRHTNGALWSEPVTVEGPVLDGNAAFYIVCSSDGDFDIEWSEDGWDAGPHIGKVELIPLPPA
jgi:hypothetical protein